MRFALAASRFVNGDLAFNLSQIERGMEAAAGAGAALLCFGEAFLQGFDAFCWRYEADREVAVSRDGAVMQRLCALTARYGVGLLVGYLERDGETLYSSCAVIDGGALIHNYRRVSRGWKEFSRTDGHYREGDDTRTFSFRGRRLQVALCGDLWDCPARFRTEQLLLWPVYVNFTPEEWAESEAEYAAQAALAAPQVLMINSLSDTPQSWGGAYYFAGGKTAARLPLGQEDILYVDL